MNASHTLPAESKYRNKKVVTPDGTFDSQKEYRRWQELKLLERAGQIAELRRQVRYELVPKCGKNRAAYYIADFVYTENNKTVVADTKGYKTSEYILKRKILAWRYEIEIEEC